MKIDYFFYQVKTEVVYTEADVDAAIRCSQRHYDAKCRAASAVGGFLYGMKNGVRQLPGEEPRETATYGFTWDQLDLLQKILEQAQGPEEVALYHTVCGIFASAREESARANAHLACPA